MKLDIQLGLNNGMTATDDACTITTRPSGQFDPYVVESTPGPKSIFDVGHYRKGCDEINHAASAASVLGGNRPSASAVAPDPIYHSVSLSAHGGSL